MQPDHKPRRPYSSGRRWRFADTDPFTLILALVVLLGIAACVMRAFFPGLF